MTYRLEVCVEDAAGIAAAASGGADRIELCSALGVGGLTPPASLIRAAAAAPLPVHLLCRPREGGFVCDAADRALVADDMRGAAEAGLAGVVIGASRADGTLDTDTLAAWVALARELGAARGSALSLTLHRAFDLVPDMAAALDDAIALGFDRVLTSGGAVKAVDGAAALAALVERSAGRIGILAGSGVSPATAPAILATGVRELHASCRRAVAQGDDTLVRFGFAAAQRMETDAGIVATLAQMVKYA